MHLTCISDEGLTTNPPAAGDHVDLEAKPQASGGFFCCLSGKNNRYNAIRITSRTFSQPLKKLNC